MAEALREVFERMGLSPSEAAEEEQCWAAVYHALLSDDKDYETTEAKKELRKAS